MKVKIVVEPEIEVLKHDNKRCSRDCSYVFRDESNVHCCRLFDGSIEDPCDFHDYDDDWDDFVDPENLVIDLLRREECIAAQEQREDLC